MILYIIRTIALFIWYLVLLSSPLYVYLGFKVWRYLKNERRKKENENDRKRSG